MKKERTHLYQLFDKFSTNLDYVSSKLWPNFFPLVKGKYACPICFTLWEKSDIDKELLTEEHSPPKSVGHNSITLTCKSCNNNQGSTIDSNLSRDIQVRSFMKRNLNKIENVIVKIDDTLSRKGTIRREENGSLKIDIPNSSFSPQQQLMMYDGKNKTLEISFFPSGKQMRSNFSLIRAAYLSAFSKLGYAFCQNIHLLPLLQYLQTPNIETNYPWKSVFCIKPKDNFHPGVYQVSSPKNNRSYMIKMQLTKSMVDQYVSVVIPGADPQGIERLYNQIATVDSKAQYSLRSLDKVNIEDERYTFFPIYMWFFPDDE